jgi:hypothetical protein
MVAVLASDGLHIGDSEGRLSQSIAAGIDQLEWLSDNKHAVVAQTDKFNSWVELETRLSPDEIAAVQKEAQVLRQAIMSIKKSIDEIDNNTTVKDLKFTNADFVFLLSTDSAFKAKFEKSLSAADEKSFAKLAYVDIHTVRVVAVSSTSMIPVRDLCSGATPIAEIRLSPTDRTLAILKEAKENRAFQLSVASLDTGKSKIVSSSANRYPDWSSDGDSIFYFEERTLPSEQPKLRFGELLKRTVTDSSGRLLDNPLEAQKLADVAFASESRIRHTNDGRIFFACPLVELPYTSPEKASNLTIFSLDPSKCFSTTTVVPGNSADLFPQYFEISSDGRELVIPKTSGATELISVITGRADTVQPFPTPGGLIVLPRFRTANEVTFVAPAAENKKQQQVPQLLLWDVSTKTSKDLSASWPISLKSRWLQE